jgi:hypothetical protein
MAVPTATVETSVVIGAIDGTDLAAVSLFGRAIQGEFDLAVTTRLWLELKKSEPSPELRAYLERIAPLGAPARLDVSSFGGGDYLSGPPLVRGDNFDSDHVEAHLRSGRSYFITRDDRQLRRARAAGVQALTPDAFLERFPRARSTE